MLPGLVTCAAFNAAPIAPPLVLLRKCAFTSPAAGVHSATFVGAVTTTVTASFSARSPKLQESAFPTIGVVHPAFEDEKNDQVNGAGSASFNVTPWATPGPRFVSTIVKVAVSPAVIKLPAPGTSGVLSICSTG